MHKTRAAQSHCLQGAQRSLIVFAVTAKHAEKKKSDKKKTQYNNKARVVHNMRLIQGRRAGQKVEVAHSVLAAPEEHVGKEKRVWHWRNIKEELEK